MAKRRGQIAMTEDEMWAFIEERRSMQVATLSKDGSPHLTTLWFAIVDGAIAFETFTKSQKIVNLKRDPRIAVLFEAGTVYNELRGVSINGVAELYSDPKDVHGFAKAVMIRNNPEVPPDKIDDAVKQLAAKRSAVVVRPQKIASWDHRKLGGSY